MTGANNAPAEGWFVTGTDTGVGKSLIAAALLMALRERGRTAVGMKPIASGCHGTAGGLRSADALRLIEAAGVPVPYEWVNPIALAPPIAPHLAAAKANVDIDEAAILAAHRRLREVASCVVVEGIGGWRVPLSARRSVADLARDFGYPILLVVGLRLGCINHALLTAEAIRRHGMPLAGWIACQVDPDYAEGEATVTALGERIGAPPLAQVPWLGQATPAAALPWLREAAAVLLRVEKIPPG